MRTNWQQAKPWVLTAAVVGVEIFLTVFTFRGRREKIKAGEEAASNLRAHHQYMEKLTKLDDDLKRRIDIGRKALEADDVLLWEQELDN